MKSSAYARLAAVVMVGSSVVVVKARLSARELLAVEAQPCDVRGIWGTVSRFHAFSQVRGVRSMHEGRQRDHGNARLG
ncbi:exported hypothetical protein [Aeromicrobium sp. 9AM]|nr:exported hypothetical protein [Aeromicrobium sp. 9AM]